MLSRVLIVRRTPTLLPIGPNLVAALVRAFSRHPREGGDPVTFLAFGTGYQVCRPFRPEYRALPRPGYFLFADPKRQVTKGKGSKANEVFVAGC